MKAFVLSGLLSLISALMGMATLFAMDVDSLSSVVAQPPAPVAAMQKDGNTIESIKHGAKLINLGFSGTIL